MKTFFSNSPFFMGILTLVLIVLIAWFIYNSISSKKPNQSSYLKSIGLFALFIGVLHQLTAWYGIINQIEQAEDITASIVISALKTTMVPLIYGVVIYLVALVLWFVSTIIVKNQE